MRKLAMLIALVIAVLFTGTAIAFEPQEQLIHEQFGTGSYATWLRDDGTWDKGPPGSLQQTKPHEYSIPAEKLENVKLTRIVVKTGYSFDPDTFEKAGGWQRIASYSKYVQEILKYTPDNLTVTDTHDLSTGKVNITWSLKLDPTFPPENGREARDTVDLSVREQLRQLGFKLEDDKAYADFREGWLWCLPVHIQWYGIPQGPVNCIASEIDPGVHGEAEPGEKYNGLVSFKYFGPEPVQGVPVGTFNGQYQAVMKDNAGNVVTTANFEPGEKKTYNFTWTAPGAGQTATLTGVINVAPLPDLFPETTKDDNKVSVTVSVKQPCTDISVKLSSAQGVERVVGDNTQLVATVTRAKNGPDSPVNVRFKFGHGSWREFTLSQGQSKTINDVVHHDRAGSISYSAEAWPVGIEDCNPANNKAAVSVSVAQKFVPPNEEGDMGTGLTGGK